MRHLRTGVEIARAIFHPNIVGHYPKSRWWKRDVALQLSLNCCESLCSRRYALYLSALGIGQMFHQHKSFYTRCCSDECEVLFSMGIHTKQRHTFTGLQAISWLGPHIGAPCRCRSASQQRGGFIVLAQMGNAFDCVFNSSVGVIIVLIHPQQHGRKLHEPRRDATQIFCSAHRESLECVKRHGSKVRQPLVKHTWLICGG